MQKRSTVTPFQSKNVRSTGEAQSSLMDSKLEEAMEYDDQNQRNKFETVDEVEEEDIEKNHRTSAAEATSARTTRTEAKGEPLSKRLIAYISAKFNQVSPADQEF